MSQINYLKRYCNEKNEALIQDSRIKEKIYWLEKDIEGSKREIILPKNDQMFHSRTSPDLMPSSLLGVNVSEIFSLLVQIAVEGRYIERISGTPRKTYQVAEMILEQMNLNRDKISDCKSLSFESINQKARNILSEWLFDNLAQYREDRSKKIDSTFITIFPFHSLIPLFWGVKEAKRVEKLVYQLLTYSEDTNTDNTILKQLKDLLDDSSVKSVGIIGKTLLLAIEDRLDKRDKYKNQTKTRKSDLEEDFKVKRPFCPVHTKQIQKDLLAVLSYSEIINKETIIKWFYSLLSSHLALYVLREANYFGIFIQTLIIEDKKSKHMKVLDCNKCNLSIDNISKCPFHPKVYPKLDDDPVVHKKSKYSLKCMEDEIKIRNLSVGLILFNLIRTCMNLYFSSDDKLYMVKDFFDSYTENTKFHDFAETYFGLLISKYLDISNTIDRKNEFFEELLQNIKDNENNIRLFYDIVSNHYTNVKSSKDSRKHFFDFYRNMSYSASNGFLLKRRGVGNYYSITDTYIQVLTQLATKESKMITYDEFVEFLKHRGICISYIDDPDNIENRTLKAKLARLGLFYGASDAKEAQFVYSMVF